MKQKYQTFKMLLCRSANSCKGNGNCISNVDRTPSPDMWPSGKFNKYSYKSMFHMFRIHVNTSSQQSWLIFDDRGVWDSVQRSHNLYNICKYINAYVCNYIYGMLVSRSICLRTCVSEATTQVNTKECTREGQ